MLGTVIGDGKATMEKEKVEAIRNWEMPITIKDVEKFLGFANFYRQFIKNFSMIAAPLNALKGGKGEKVWKWETKEQKAFESIKEAITTEPVLTLLNEEGTFRVEVDASNMGTGAVLSQEQQGKWHPVAFMSKSLIDAERNYEIYDKELLAIVKALKVWRHYLVHAKNQFKICRPQKPEILQGTPETKCPTSAMVHHAPRIQLPTPTHSWKDEHQSRHTLMTVQNGHIT
jgi:hypothetical protein